MSVSKDRAMGFSVQKSNKLMWSYLYLGLHAKGLAKN